MNVSVDDKLLQEALRVGRFRTKRKTVEKALEEFIQRRRRMVLCAVGSFEFRRDWNYKQDRMASRHWQ